MIFFDKIELDKLRTLLEGIVGNLIASSIPIDIENYNDIRENLKEYKKTRNTLSGIYIWHARCNPFTLVEKWQKRVDLYNRFNLKNLESKTLVTKSNKSINFLLPKVNPYWNRNNNYTQEETDVTLYVGKAVGNDEDLIKRLQKHYSGSIQVSALKLNGSIANKDKMDNDFLKAFFRDEKKLLKQIGFKKLWCNVILIDNSEKDRILTYERIIREVKNPVIGEE